MGMAPAKGTCRTTVSSCSLERRSFSTAAARPSIDALRLTAMSAVSPASGIVMASAPPAGELAPGEDVGADEEEAGGEEYEEDGSGALAPCACLRFVVCH